MVYPLPAKLMYKNFTTIITSVDLITCVSAISETNGLHIALYIGVLPANHCDASIHGTGHTGNGSQSED